MQTPMASRAKLRKLERRIVIGITAGPFLVALAIFASALFAHQNTMAITDSLVRWLRPGSSANDIERIHNVARKFGHFLIPAAAFALLVIGPLRQRPLAALVLCALFAVIDESIQAFTPGRNGSVLDVILDTSGALCGFFLNSAIARWPRRKMATSSSIKPLRR
ncbi:MAG: VanZ family protein [Candidatus Binataceae bacterium]